MFPPKFTLKIRNIFSGNNGIFSGSSGIFSGGQGTPVAPDGYAFLVTRDGRYLITIAGYYIIAKI